MINKAFLLAIPALLISGCMSTVTNLDNQPQITTNQVHNSINNLNDISWAAITLPSESIFSLSANSQQFLSPTSAGAIAAFTVPADRGVVTINLKSYAKKDLYAANILVLNEKNEHVAALSFKDFIYYPAKMLEKDAFVGHLTVIPYQTDQELRILIFTTPEDIQSKSTILHPAKAFAIAKNTVPPAIADPIIPHVTNGSFYLEVTSPNISSDHIYQQTANDYAPTLQETQSYYLDAIDTAINKGNIDKAMRLLDEAEKLGIKGAREQFINAIKLAP